MIFNRKASNSSPVMPPHSSLLHLHPTLVSNTGDAANIAWDSLLFLLTDSTPDLDLMASQWRVILYVFSFLKDPGPYIS